VSVHRVSVPDLNWPGGVVGCIAWRKEHNIDKVLQSPLDPKKLEVIRRHKPSSYIGFDKLVRAPGLLLHRCPQAGGRTSHLPLGLHQG
jgi:hypothetical protein